MMKRSDLHTHTLLSDGELVPAELVRRAEDMSYEAIGLTDHVDSSNLEWVIERTLKISEDLNETLDIRVIPGVELTHVPPENISELSEKARGLGIKLIAVHGETPVEPVKEGTNRAALECNEVNMLVHPGRMTLEQAKLARETGTYLELTSRAGHCLTNGLVAKLAQEAGADLLVNTDAHAPADLLTLEEALMVAKGAGLSEEEAEKAVGSNPMELLEGI
ncbi:MAG: histidinol phosphate phosphatase domain-containing protein [Hadesarchaea archaeon]|nr:histidinol phosphate phosphatase domain-containing protein [Hadesarchaea archaeon]